MAEKYIFAHHFNTFSRVRRTHEEIVRGLNLHIKGRPVLCTRGFHGSINVLDALSYCERHVIQKIFWNPRILSGEIDYDEDKVAASHCWWPFGGFDCTTVILDFCFKFTNFETQSSHTALNEIFAKLDAEYGGNESYPNFVLEKMLWDASGFDRSELK